jgi:chromosome segregation ATPase
MGELQALQRRGSELDETSTALRDRESAIAGIRARAEEIDAFFAAYPETEARLRAGIDEAQDDHARRRDELAAAEHEAAQARDEEQRARLEHVTARARDRLADAGARLDRAHAAHEELERRAAELPGELARLEDDARRIAGAALPDPGSRGLVEWASHAHAEVFVELGQVDRQRDQLVREANELGSLLLGEPAYGLTPSQVLARVERTP